MGTTASSSRGKPSPSPSPSASAIVPATSRGRHVFELRRYSMIRDTTPTGKAVTSLSFKVGGHNWHVECYPNGYGPEQADSVSLVLILEVDDHVADKLVTADYTFSLAGDERDFIFKKKLVAFQRGSNWGLLKFIGNDELERSACLVNDCLTIICDLVVVSNLRKEKTKATAAAAAALNKAPPPRPFVVVPPSDMRRHFGDLLTGQACPADVTFVIRGETITAHRCVLAARSPVFRAQLFGPMADGKAGHVIRIYDMEADVFRALLDFIYTESLPWSPPSTTKHNDGEMAAMAQHLLVAADRYQMERLRLICEDKLCEYIDQTSVTGILALADRHRCHGLKTACFQFLVTANTEAFVAPHFWDTLCLPYQSLDP